MSVHHSFLNFRTAKKDKAVSRGRQGRYSRLFENGRDNEDFNGSRSFKDRERGAKLREKNP